MKKDWLPLHKQNYTSVASGSKHVSNETDWYRCGERRYRASKLAERINIPSVIRELTDQEVREIQLIENFQREDPHPMEEAVAIHAATVTGQYTIEDLAHKVGKPKKYIAQRLKLMDLITPLQAIFFENKINITSAMKLATISNEDQKRFVNKAKSDSHYLDSTQVNAWIIQCQGNLNKAVFDLNDPTLSPDFGPCTTCPFNSRNANLLFPDDTKDHVCMNNQDYQRKIEVHYERASALALEDPSIVFITATYNTSVPEAEKFKAAGHVVLKKYDDYDLVEVPKKQSLKEDDFPNEPEYQDAMIRANGAYERALAAFEKKQNTGKLVKAFVVAGEDKGATVFVELKKKAEQKVATTSIAAGTADTNDIDAEINRLTEREVRSKELDAEKVHIVVKELFRDINFIETDNHLTDTEIIAAIVAMWEAGSYNFQERISKAYNFQRHITGMELYSRLADLRDQFALITKVFILDKLKESTSSLTSAAGRALHDVANQYLPQQVKKAVDDQDAIAQKRIARVNSRIEDLELQKKSLQQEAKPARRKLKTEVV